MIAPFAYLKDLNASVLKIDRSFVTDIETNRDNQAIVRSTIKMAHELGMKVVAEGIETEQDEIYLKSLGCDVRKRTRSTRGSALGVEMHL